jgi:hypothetical protein
MDEPPELQYNGHWRMAVWALRVGYVGLAVAIAGLIVMSLGPTPWVLAVGVFIWLAAEAVTLAGFFWSRHELSEPRPGYWSMRFMLIHDTATPSHRPSDPNGPSLRCCFRRATVPRLVDPTGM